METDQYGQVQQQDAAMIDSEFADTRIGGAMGMDVDDFEGRMIDDDLNMSGQFSPPHEPNTGGRDISFSGQVDKQRGSMIDSEQDSPYVDEMMQKQEGQAAAGYMQDIMPKSPVYEIEDSAFSS